MNRSLHSLAMACCLNLAAVNGAAANDGERVIDIRDLKSCASGSLPGARCLPVTNFVRPDGESIGFHALRWLLGTVGLSGHESVLVIGADTQDIKTVAALLYQAGQHRVRTLDKPFAAATGAPGGEVRSLSREVVFTQPMRRSQLN